jgi:hypothetical protein
VFKDLHRPFAQHIAEIRNHRLDEEESKAGFYPNNPLQLKRESSGLFNPIEAMQN